MKVGFTGTQIGMTDEQLTELIYILTAGFEPGTQFHHGKCLGADKEAYTVAKRLNYKTVGHPPINQSKMALCDDDEEREPAEYLVRNHNIVDETELLVACPKGPEELRSGTWATIRYAAKVGKLTIIIWPDGNVETR